MKRRMAVWAFLLASLSTGEVLGQDTLDVEADGLRLEIARLKASLSECQEKLEAIEKQLTRPPARIDSAIVRPRFALDGFCPVALVEAMRRAQPKWSPGRPEIARDYEGLEYHFSSEEALKAFERDPCQYALVMQGFDAVVAMRESRRVAGCRDYGARWRDRTYVFASRESYDAFRESPQEYATFALHVPAVEFHGDVWSAAWSCLSRYRPVEAWVVRSLFEVCGSPGERDQLTDDILPAGYFQQRLHLLVPADRWGEVRGGVSSDRY